MALFYSPVSIRTSLINLDGLAIPAGPVNMTGIVSESLSGDDMIAEFSPLTITSVPEPPTLTLAGIGAVFLLAAICRHGGEAMHRMDPRSRTPGATGRRKHGGDQRCADLDLDALVAPGPEMDLLALDAALDRLVPARSAEGAGSSSCCHSRGADAATRRPRSWGSPPAAPIGSGPTRGPGCAASWASAPGPDARFSGRGGNS